MGDINEIRVDQPVMGSEAKALGEALRKLLSGEGRA